MSLCVNYISLPLVEVERFSFDFTWHKENTSATPEMISVFLISLFTFISPAVALVTLSRFYRAKAFIFLPISIAVSFGTVGIGATITHSLLSNRWGNFFVLLAISSLSTCLVFEYGTKLIPTFTARIHPRHLILLALITFLFSIDVMWIFSKQHYSLDASTYLRLPFQDDLIRHLAIVNYFIRKGPQPFLPNAPFIFQEFWYYGAASFISLFPFRTTRLDQVYGYCLTTGVIFFFLLLWASVIFRPTLLQKGKLFVFSILCLLHADVYNLGVCFFNQHRLGIEADQSYLGSFFRCFTPKLIFLTAPHHAAFCIFFLLYLTMEKAFKKSAFSRALFFILSFLASPLLAAFAFTALWAEEFIRLGRLYKNLCLLILASLLYRSFFRFWPHELLLRRGLGESVELVIRDAFPYLNSPFLFIATMGASGFLVFPLMQRLFFKLRKRAFLKLGCIYLLIGNIFFQFLVTGLQIRRHFSIVSSLMVVIFLAKHLPNSRKWQTTAKLFALISIIGHAYFMFCFLGKPSYVDPSISWKDYFALNTVIEKKFAGLPLIAASDPLGTGIVFPIALEVTGVFSLPVIPLLFSKVSDDQFKWIMRTAKTQGDIAPYAERLGYKAIIWGPIEKKVWGEKIKKRFIRNDNLLAREGEVELYELSDSLRERVGKEANPNSAAFYTNAAKEFEKDGWKQEAYTYFYQALILNPLHIPAHKGLAHLLRSDARFEEALKHDKEFKTLDENKK